MEIKEGLERLESFKELEENWDSYGGKPISPAAIATAEKMLKGFFVCPISDGTIAISFGDEEWTFKIDEGGDVYVHVPSIEVV